ncbi:hypothetical protein BT67DRAFT_220349 [Trichocladium antarcticum]|uniref:Uncharacterized protein n=1 Tax=Trichocladium antarcticum TaxID=1450529 RepID=A0AAN6UCF7_9PEZI|nr:hypothetical protein BT67DRAFT_220349 [Trichocladium antarcticum]
MSLVSLPRPLQPPAFTAGKRDSRERMIGKATIRMPTAASAAVVGEAVAVKSSLDIVTVPCSLFSLLFARHGGEPSSSRKIQHCTVRWPLLQLHSQKDHPTGMRASGFSTILRQRANLEAHPAPSWIFLNTHAAICAITSSTLPMTTELQAS